MSFDTVVAGLLVAIMFGVPLYLLLRWPFDRSTRRRDRE